MNLNVLTLFVLIFLFGCTESDRKDLPQIHIFSKQEIPTDRKIYSRIIYVENGDSLHIKTEIKRRGGASVKYKKHSFRIELEKKIPLVGLPRDDDWILNANYIDKTFMRHKISYDLFRKMHPENIAPRCAYVEVFLNENYAGLYVLMEKIDASTGFLKKKDPSASLFKDPPIFFENRLEKVQEPNNYYQQKFPKIHKTDQTKIIEAFQAFLFNSSDSVFQKEIAQRVNLRNVIDWHLLLLFSNNSDGIMKNFYFLKRNFEMPFEFVPWDYDHSFGRDGDNEMNLMRHELDVNRSVLLRRLNKDKQYRIRLKNRYRLLRERGIFSVKHFKKMISQNDEIIRPHVERNFEKWPVNGYWYFDDAAYEDELKLMEKFVEMRLMRLDTFFDFSIQGG